MLYQQTTGYGNTIVFIHGNSQASSIWDILINEPSLSNYTLTRLDLPGHGQSFRSNDPEKDYSFKGLGTHVKDHLTAMGIGECIIVALSMSGNMIAEVIRNFPMCKGLMLVGTCVIGPQFNVSEIAQPSPHFGVTFDSHPTDDDLDKFLDTWAVNMPEELKSECVKMYWDTDTAFRAQMGKVVVGGEWTDEISNLEKLDYPVAILYGDKEKIIFPQYLSRSAINMWRNEIIMIGNAGHFCHLDNPKQFAAIVSQYADDIFTASGS